MLIADDDPSLRALVHRVLSSEGYELLEARDGDETLERMRRGRPDIVLLDLQMPAMSGWDVLSMRQRDEVLSILAV